MTMEQIYARQSLPLSSIANARQLGGYTMSNGCRVRKGLLFRSGKLMNATPQDLDFLAHTLGVKTVIDLRTAFELEHMPDRMVPDASYVNMPVEDADNNMWLEMFQFPGETMHDQLLAFCRTERAKRMTEETYIGYVADEFCQLQYAAFFQKLLFIEGPVLWHCTQGKDRTGLASAFLLAILGADRKTIVEDFALTNVPYQPIVDALEVRLRASGGNDDDLRVIQAMEGVSIPYFEKALDYIDTIYGSMDNYLRNILVLTDKEKDILRHKYLES